MLVLRVKEMSKVCHRLFSLVACLFLAGQSLVATGQSVSGYPAPVPDFAQWEKFPADCAGYHRGAVTAYAPALADYSVAYDRYDAVLQNAVTLFFYPRFQDMTAQLRAEEAEVLKAHPNGRIVDRRSFVLEREGRSYDATSVTFEFGGFFAAKQQSLNSELLVVFLRAGTFKVRSTAPVGQAAMSGASVRQLLQCVAWAS